MKAVQILEHGGPEKLELRELDEPSASPGTVVLRVRAAALNRFDALLREGRQLFDKHRTPTVVTWGTALAEDDAPGLALPYTMGLECVGEVVEVGPDADGWSVGQRALPYIMMPCRQCVYCRSGRGRLCVAAGWVSMTTGGAWAEYVEYPASDLIRVPDGVSDEDAAATQLAFATSWNMLFTQGGLRAGETVLVNSVGSGIGSAAVQLAKLAGAFVIGTSSSDEKLDAARRLGMDVGINYRTQDMVDEAFTFTGGRGVDLVYEHVGGDLFLQAIETLTKGGRIVTCGGFVGEHVQFDLIRFFRGEFTLRGSFIYEQTDIERCLELVAGGLIKPVVSEVLPLADAGAAMQLMDSGRQFGKILLRP